MLNFYSADTSSMNWFQKLCARSLIFTFFVEHGFSYAIKWYTQLWKPEDMPFDKIPTHMSNGKVKAGTIPEKYIMFESEERQKLSKWDNPPYSFIYLKNGQPFYDEEIFWEIVEDTEKKPYAFFQLIGLVWRYVMKKYFKKEMKRNWFTTSRVCSEQSYVDYKNHHDKHKMFILSWIKFIKYNPNLFAPIDGYNLCKFTEDVGEGKFIGKAY